MPGLEKSTAIEFDSTEAHLSRRLPFQLAMQRFSECHAAF